MKLTAELCYSEIFVDVILSPSDLERVQKRGFIEAQAYLQGTGHLEKKPINIVIGMKEFEHGEKSFKGKREIEKGFG
jgi:hypothetical protein